MRNQKNRTPPHIKINCWMYHLFLPPPIGVSWLPHLVRSPQPAGNCVPEFACEVGMQFPLAAPLGSHIPLRPQIPGRAFRQTPQPETTSHSKGKFRDTASAPSRQEKSLEDFEAFTFVLFCTKDRERRSYSPSTAFLAAAAMMSRSSLVGWSFAATQLSSSILNRAFSGSCSSMAS